MPSYQQKIGEKTKNVDNFVDNYTAQADKKEKNR